MNLNDPLLVYVYVTQHTINEQSIWKKEVYILEEDNQMEKAKVTKFETRTNKTKAKEKSVIFVVC